MTTQKPNPIALVWAGGKPPRSLDAAAIQTVLRKFLRALGYPRCGLTVMFGGDADLLSLNAHFLGRAKATDVLSWSYLEDKRHPPAVLGDLALSIDRIKAQARANGWSMQTEALRLLAHGCVHLLGYDHMTDKDDRAMRRLEEKLLAKVGLKGLYPPEAKQRRRP